LAEIAERQRKNRKFLEKRKLSNNYLYLCMETMNY
jgi:hypothetical protein